MRISGCYLTHKRLKGLWSGISAGSPPNVSFHCYNLTTYSQTKRLSTQKSCATASRSSYKSSLLGFVQLGFQVKGHCGLREDLLCVFSHSSMSVLAHLKDMCSLRVPLSSTHSISVPTLALLPPEVGRAKSPVIVRNHRARPGEVRLTALFCHEFKISSLQAVEDFIKLWRSILRGWRFA